LLAQVGPFRNFNAAPAPAAAASSTPPATDAIRPTDPQLKSALSTSDQAAKLLEQGKGEDAAALYHKRAQALRQEASKNPNSMDGALKNALADNFAARAAAYRAKTPAQAQAAAQQLQRTSHDLGVLAGNQEQQNGRWVDHFKGDDAKALKAICSDSSMQAGLMNDAAHNEGDQKNLGVSKFYRDIVNRTFEQKEKDVSGLHNAIWGDRDKMKADQTTVNQALDEVERTMKAKHCSMGEAWNDMARIVRVNGSVPQQDGPRDPKAPDQNERYRVAMALRDNDVTKGLLSPFCDLSDAVSHGDKQGADLAQGKVAQALADNHEFGVAKEVLAGYQNNAQTAEGKMDAARLQSGISSQQWKATASDFVLKEMPVLVATGIISGGIGDLAAGGAAALRMGATAQKVVQVSTELGAFVPTEHVLNSAINGKPGDWSAGGLARDYALTIGGYGLFKGLGKGWAALRGLGAEAGDAGAGLKPKIPGEPGGTAPPAEVKPPTIEPPPTAEPVRPTALPEAPQAGYDVVGQHMAQPGSIGKSGKGVLGSHLDGDFQRVLGNQGVVTGQAEVPGFDGMKKVEYKMFRKDATGAPTQDLANGNLEKTIFDPNKWSAQDISKLARNIFGDLSKACPSGSGTIEATYNGQRFIGWVRNGQLQSFGVK
jgi:hypothetical protein